MLTATTAVAGQLRQPISISMVECAAIYGELAGMAERRGREETDVRYAADMAVSFAEAARHEAEAERQAGTAPHLSAIFSEMEQKWDGRFSNPMKLSENKDWIDYCRALGRDRGILTRPN